MFFFGNSPEAASPSFFPTPIRLQKLGQLPTSSPYPMAALIQYKVSTDKIIRKAMGPMPYFNYKLIRVLCQNGLFYEVTYYTEPKLLNKTKFRYGRWRFRSSNEGERALLLSRIKRCFIPNGYYKCSNDIDGKVRDGYWFQVHFDDMTACPLDLPDFANRFTRQVQIRKNQIEMEPSFSAETYFWSIYMRYWPNDGSVPEDDYEIFW